MITQTSYPVFENGQVLTKNHLNDLVDYLEQQDRLTPLAANESREIERSRDPGRDVARRATTVGPAVLDQPSDQPRMWLFVGREGDGHSGPRGLSP